MKTKAYKLAAELGLQEHTVLDWLRAHGYPNVRRADTIRADVARRARTALKRQGGGRAPRGRLPTAGRGLPTAGRSDPVNRAGQGAAEPTGQDLRVSFAEMLEAHLPSGGRQAPLGGRDITATQEGMPIPRIPQVSTPPPPKTPAAVERAMRQQLEGARADREAARKEAGTLRAALDATRRELAHARQIKAETEILTERLEMTRIDLDRARGAWTLAKHELKTVQDERATLEHTCTELQDELIVTRETLAAVEAEREEHGTALENLEEAMQREVAWRTRALELERTAHQGANLTGILRNLGVGEASGQARVLRALLGERQTALPLLRAIRQVDADVISRLLKNKLLRVCAHPVCNYVAQTEGRVVLRVDAEAECQVCEATEDQRWFARMVSECTRAGARRILVIGADDLHEPLRALGQGEPVALRLVSATDAVHSARVRGRVEGCDAVVIWSETVTPKPVTESYLEAAYAEGRPVVSVLGKHAGIAQMARSVCNRLARASILLPR